MTVISLTEQDGRRAQQHQAELARRDPALDAYAELVAYVRADRQWRELMLGFLALAYARSEFERFVQVTHAQTAIERRERELVATWFALRGGR